MIGSKEWLASLFSIVKTPLLLIHCWWFPSVEIPGALLVATVGLGKRSELKVAGSG